MPQFTRHMLRFSLLAIAATALSAVGHAQKLRVGVLSFTLGEDAANKAKVSLGITGNLGGDLSAKMITRLYADGKFEVISITERKKIGEEKTMQQGAGVDTQTAVQLGREQGVQAVLIGTITELSGDSSTNNFGVFTQQTFKVHVVADVQLIDVATSRLLSAATGSGDASTTKRGMPDVTTTSGKRAPNAPTPAATSAFGTGFSNGLLQKATAQAIDQIVRQLDAAPGLAAAAAAPPPPVLPAVRHAYTGTVADVNGANVIFRLPTPDAAQVGDAVTVDRVVRNVPDPDDPKKILRTITEVSARGKVTEVDAASSTATAQITDGTVKVKDKINFKP